MNSKLYKEVHSLATQLLAAAEKEDGDAFAQGYEQLKALCFDNEEEEKNHPVQWETLGDFSEDSDEAMLYYKKALGFADEIQAKDYMTSISYAMALLQQEVGDNEQALALAHQAAEYAEKISDAELQQEVADLIKALI